jgi:hypothetical protein
VNFVESSEEKPEDVTYAELCDANCSSLFKKEIDNTVEEEMEESFEVDDLV